MWRIFFLVEVFVLPWIICKMFQKLFQQFTVHEIVKKQLDSKSIMVIIGIDRIVKNCWNILAINY